MNPAEAVQALLALEACEAERQRQEAEQRAAAESTSAAGHWEKLRQVMAQTLPDVVLAAAEPTKPEDWSSQTRQYTLTLRLKQHGEITTQFTHGPFGWIHDAWRANADDFATGVTGPWWAVHGYGCAYYCSLARALVKAREVGDREIPF